MLLIGFRLAQAAQGVADHEQISIDPYTVLKDFNLEPLTTTYVCCEACHTLYQYDAVRNVLPGVSIPFTCTTKPTPGSVPCGHSLWKEAHLGAEKRTVPRIKYLHRGLKDWLGRLLARPGMEDILERSYHTRQRVNMTDIHDSPLWHLFLGPDGKPFITSGNGEGRYMFSFGMDGFNPFQAKQAKQTISSTALYMVLLNLPPNLRYLPENMYLVSVIPGHPSTDAINNALKLVVDDFLEFWTPGVRFTHTYN